MQKEIFDELNRIADGFWKDRKILDRNKLEQIDYLQISGFAMQFSTALKNFLQVRRIDIKNSDHNIDKILGINPTHDFVDGCDKFLDVVTIAKEYDLIIDKQITKELEECKENQEKTTKMSQVKDDMITQLKDTNRDLQTKIDIALRTYPTLKKILYGNSNESEVQENV